MITRSASILLAFIRSVETGRKDGSSYTTIYGHNEKKLPKPLTSMTVDEVIAAGPSWTKAYGSSASGAYQFMNATLKDLKRTERLTGKEKFTPELQDRLGMALLRRRGFSEFTSGAIGLNAFGLNLAKEWASLPVLEDTKGQHRAVKRGETYYAGDKLNRALVTPETVIGVLSQVKSASSVPAPAGPTEGVIPAALVILVVIALIFIILK